MNILGHNPNGLVSAFCRRNTFKVPTKRWTVTEAHKVCGAGEPAVYTEV